jgi:hypothetical protein
VAVVGIVRYTDGDEQTIDIDLTIGSLEPLYLNN